VLLLFFCEIDSHIFFGFVTLGLTTASVKQIRNSLFNFCFMLVSEVVFLFIYRLQVVKNLTKGHIAWGQIYHGTM